MRSMNTTELKLPEEEEGQGAYEAPAIVYEGHITARAGTGGINSQDTDIDPAGLFSR
jgi:hypothetical protein